MTAIDLTGRAALVTGGAQGLGAGMARALAAAGARVMIADIQDTGSDTAAALGAGHGFVRLDVTDEAGWEQAIAATVEQLGGLDVLVNNAGIGTPVAAEDEPVAEFARVVDVNLTSLFALSQLAGRQMIAQGHGSIINIASILGLVASAPIKQASYTASKGAVVNLTRELGVQWARKGVRVNAIAPGWFPSEMTADMFTEGPSADYLHRNAPMGRGGDLHELDGALLFLAGDASTYVTGHTLTVDGGWTAR